MNVRIAPDWAILINFEIVDSSTAAPSVEGMYLFTKIFCKGSLRLTVTNVQGGLSHTTGTPCKGFLRRRHIDAVFVTKLDLLPAWCVFPTLTAVFVERQKTIVKRGKNQLYLIEPPASQPLLCTSLYFLLFPFLNIAM